jgi:EAL domain-containing protein (putative c-di-GMP-specific phosphodiesterase class I)
MILVMDGLEKTCMTKKIHLAKYSNADDGDRLDVLSLAALVTIVSLVSLLFSFAWQNPLSSAAMPAISAGLLVGVILLIRQGRKVWLRHGALRAQLSYLLHHDIGTQLLNPGGLNRKLLAYREDALQAGTWRGYGAVLAICLTRLGKLREDVGDVYADEAFDGLVSRLKQVFGDQDQMALFSDDSVFVWTTDLDLKRFILMGDQLRGLLDHPLATPAGTTSLLPAVGVFFSDEDCSDPAEALRRARLALTAAKLAPSQVALFDPALDQAGKTSVELELELRSAIKQRSLRLAYQPQINEQEELVGVEALMRWHHPVRGDIPPSLFVPLAESCGLGEALGEIALDIAMQDSKLWPGIKVAVNVSPVQLRSKAFLPVVERLLKSHGVKAQHFELEITEGILLEQDPTVVGNLARLKSLGFQIALDDFGTGYSSLGYLSQFAVDKIKIDRCFVTNLGERPDASAIIKAIVDLSGALGLSVLAEGIETGEQLRLLRKEGCNLAQGYYLGRPTSAAVISSLTQPATRVRTHSQKRTVAARAMAERKTVGHRS